MRQIKAIGFDLFNTLVTMDPRTLKSADAMLLQSLRDHGFRLEETGESFQALDRTVIYVNHNSHNRDRLR